MLTTMPCQVALPIVIEVKTPRYHPARHRLFPYSCVHDLALPFDLAWKTNVH